MIDIKHIEAAYDRIKDYVARTRLEKSLYLSEGDTEVYMKLECEQPIVKNFKLRGVLGKLTLLTDEQLKNGYGTISSGNQGVSVSYASQLLKLDRPYIVVPENTPKPKLEKMEKFGADIHKFGHSFDEANGTGEAIFEEKGIIKFITKHGDVKKRKFFYIPNFLFCENLLYLLIISLRKLTADFMSFSGLSPTSRSIVRKPL